MRTYVDVMRERNMAVAAKAGGKAKFGRNDQVRWKDPHNTDSNRPFVHGFITAIGGGKISLIVHEKDAHILSAGVDYAFPISYTFKTWKEQGEPEIVRKSAIVDRSDAEG
jgi:hypothetical protein